MNRPACLALLASAAVAHALVIQLDYTYDIADGGNFFGTHPAAKASLEQAAADLSAAITSTLAAVNTDVFTGTQSGATASIDWALDFFNPVTDDPLTLETFTFAADTVRIFAGMRALTGTTLGEGGPIGVFTDFSAENGSLANRITAFNAAEAASNAVMPRGGGPTIGTLSNTFDTDPYSLTYGALAGTLSFDNDTDNNGSADSEAVLDAYWHFDLAQPVEPGQFDFYSAALHEMIHALGFGVSDSWDALRSGTTWLGGEAIALAGSGVGLVTANGHITAGVTSFRLSDGAVQEVVMDPSLLSGTRKSLTELDLAFLRDLGYATVPEPSTAALLAFALALTSRRRSRSPAPSAGKFCRRS